MFCGSRLRAIRERAGLTREELGQKAGVGVTTIYEWEASRKGPKTLDRLGKALGVSPSEFFAPYTEGVAE